MVKFHTFFLLLMNPWVGGFEEGMLCGFGVHTTGLRSCMSVERTRA